MYDIIYYHLNKTVLLKQATAWYKKKWEEYFINLLKGINPPPPPPDQKKKNCVLTVEIKDGFISHYNSLKKKIQE